MNCYKIGEIFLWHSAPGIDVELTVVADKPDDTCEKCYFYPCIALLRELQDKIGYCTEDYRPDNTAVHFEKVK